MPFVVEVTYPAYIFITRNLGFVNHKYTEAGVFLTRIRATGVECVIQPQLTLL